MIIWNLELNTSLVTYNTCWTRILINIKNRFDERIDSISFSTDFIITCCDKWTSLCNKSTSQKLKWWIPEKCCDSWTLICSSGWLLAQKEKKITFRLSGVASGPEACRDWWVWRGGREVGSHWLTAESVPSQGKPPAPIYPLVLPSQRSNPPVF